MKANPEAALPFMALGAIINANNAGLPEDLDVTLNCRYVYRPPFDPPDVERKFGNLTLTYAAQIHVGRRRDRSRDGGLRGGRLRGRGRLRQADQPAGGRGPGDGRDRAGARRGDARDLHLRRGRQPADAQLLRLPRAACARHAAARDGQHREPLAVHLDGHEGDGRGRRRRHPRRLRSTAGRAQLARQADRLRQLQSRTTASGSCSPIRRPAGSGSAWRPGEGRRRARLHRAAGSGLARAQRPGLDGGDDAGRGELRRPGRPPLEGQREDPARARGAGHDDGHGEDRGARAGVRAPVRSRATASARS